MPQGTLAVLTREETRRLVGSLRDEHAIRIDNGRPMRPVLRPTERRIQQAARAMSPELSPVAARWVSKHSVELVDAIRAAFTPAGTTPEQKQLINEWVRQAVMR
jgi:hypothetical protein